MKILVADDDRITTTVLTKVLTEWGFDVTVEHNGLAAWERLIADRPGMAIVDWMMPGLDGPDLCQRIRQDSRTSSLHVILLTGRTEKADLIAGLDAGADDYMAKPFEIEELRARVQVGVRVVRLQERLAAEVEHLHAAQERLQHLADTDPLTGLLNRRSWCERGASEFDRARRYKRPLAILMADLDHFKRVNDAFGHAVGDDVLKQFASLLMHECRASDVVGRSGGEEFSVLLPETGSVQALDVARRIVRACEATHVTAPGADVRFTCSIGVTGVEPLDPGLDDAIRRADEALYEAKRSGRNRACGALVGVPARSSSR